MPLESFRLVTDPPSNWDTRAYERPPYPPTFQAATVKLPEPSDTALDEIYEMMGPDDAYIEIVDLGAPPSDLGREGHWKAGSVPLRVVSSDVLESKRDFRGGLPAGIDQAVTVGSRALSLTVRFGSSPTQKMLTAINGILAALEMKS